MNIKDNVLDYSDVLLNCSSGLLPLQKLGEEVYCFGPDPQPGHGTIQGVIICLVMLICLGWLLYYLAQRYGSLLRVWLFSLPAARWLFPRERNKFAWDAYLVYSEQVRVMVHQTV